MGVSLRKKGKYKHGVVSRSEMNHLPPHPHSLCFNQGFVSLLTPEPSTLLPPGPAHQERHPLVSLRYLHRCELSLRLKHHIPVTLGPYPLF